MITINGNFNFFLKIINLTVEYINGLFDLTEGQMHLGKPFTVDHFSHFEVDELNLKLGKQNSNCKIPVRNMVRQ